MRLGFAIAIVFSAAFALFEVFGRWRLLSCRVFPCRPRILGFMPYHVFILVPMFVAVALVCVKSEGKRIAAWPSIAMAAGFFTFMILLEDILYFVISGFPIKPDTFTTQFGYVTTPFVLIPLWYFAAGPASALLLGLARIGEQRRSVSAQMISKKKLEP